LDHLETQLVKIKAIPVLEPKRSAHLCLVGDAPCDGALPTNLFDFRRPLKGCPEFGCTCVPKTVLF
jgi:hypothetical protein